MTKSLERHIAWIFPLAVFLVVRLFSSDPYYLLSGDQCTFLQLGRTFPRHHLFNHELYLIHPPVFGFAIGLLNFLLPLLAAGLATTLLFAGINFFILHRLAVDEQLPTTAVFVALMYLALHRAAVAYDYQVARVSILVCATSLAIWTFLNMLKEPSRKTVIVAIISNAFCLLIGDQALVLLAAEAVILCCWRRQRPWRPLFLLGAISAAAALCWPAVRLFHFLTRNHVPAGIDGTIEFTENFPLSAVIQPNFLPFTNTHRSLFTETSLSLTNFQLGRLVSLPMDLLILPTYLSAALIVALIAAGLISRPHRVRAFQWLALSILFLLPVGIGMYEWYGMGFIVPFTLLMAEGGAGLVSLAGSLYRNPNRILTPALCLGCVVLIGLWLTDMPSDERTAFMPGGGVHFLFNRPPVTRGAEIAKFFASMPRDVGIMAPVDLTPEIVYHTDKRVVAIPFDPVLLDRFIKEYEISYLVLSSEYLRRFETSLKEQYTSSLVARHIISNPERYPLIHSIREDYSAFYPPLEYYIFRTDRNALRG